MTKEARTNKYEAMRAYSEEKTRMQSSNANLTQKMKKLENTIKEFSELEAGAYLPEGGIISTASEIEENVDAVRAAFGKMETINEALVERTGDHCKTFRISPRDYVRFNPAVNVKAWTLEKGCNIQTKSTGTSYLARELLYPPANLDQQHLPESTRI